MPKIAIAVLLTLTIAASAVGAAIAFGGPGQPKAMPSINDPFKGIDYADLPAPSHFLARDGAPLAYLAYAAQGPVARGSVVLVHGSSARGRSLHWLAKAFAAAGYAAYALDVRGHGDSGIRGTIATVGQLDDDLEDFMRSVAPAAPATLVGFSSGGGFALRVAASERQRQFANYLLMSPFISPNAPTYRPDGGGWVSVGVPRIVALTLLEALGVQAFNQLPVTRFALDERAKAFLTPAYSYALAANFRPQRDYRASIRRADQPMAVLAGRNDEVFHADRFAAVFAAEGKAVPVTLLDGIDHIGLTLQPQALAATVAAVNELNAAAH